MLTKIDLSKIKTVVHEEVSLALDKELGLAIDKALDRKLEPAIDKALDKRLELTINKALDKKMEPMFDKKLKPIKQDIAKIRKDITMVISFFDREYVDLRARVERIEDHLHLSPAS